MGKIQLPVNSDTRPKPISEQEKRKRKRIPVDRKGTQAPVRDPNQPAGQQGGFFNRQGPGHRWPSQGGSGIRPIPGQGGGGFRPGGPNQGQGGGGFRPGGPDQGGRSTSTGWRQGPNRFGPRSTDNTQRR